MRNVKRLSATCSNSHPGTVSPAQPILLQPVAVAADLLWEIMKPFLVTIASAAVGFSQLALCQETPTQGSRSNPATTAVPASPEKPKPKPEELEAKFKAMLTEATMIGRWASLKEGTLGPEKEDKYHITGVNKLGGDTWVIHARMQYGKREFVAPIPVVVQWAGDTPVIIVDKLQVPGGGTYSARVLVYDQTYAGTWSGGEHGGLLYGVIKNDNKRESQP